MTERNTDSLHCPHCGAYLESFVPCACAASAPSYGPERSVDSISITLPTRKARRLS